MAIYVADAIMSSGKTEGSIHFINTAPPGKRFLYVTPFCTECDRICAGCVAKRFRQPTGEDVKKTRELISMLQRGENVVITHALFLLSIYLCKDLIINGNYTLVQDESLPVVQVSSPETFGLTEDDMEIAEAATETDSDGRVIWKKDGYKKGTYSQYADACRRGEVYTSNNYQFLRFNMEVFSWFEDVYVLTYLFQFSMQRSMFDLYGYKYTYIGVEKIGGEYVFTDYKTTPARAREYLSRIHIADNKTLVIGNKDGTLSYTWYEDALQEELDALEEEERQRKPGERAKRTIKTNLRQLGNGIRSFFQKTCSCDKAEDKELCIWTTFKACSEYVYTHKFDSRFISCSLRASNDYRHCRYLAYCVNRYMNPVLSNYLKELDVPVNQDGYALSEMLQWIWRSAIRTEDGEIWVYIPSRRMRSLFKAWLEELHDGGHGDEDHIFVRAKEIYKAEEIKESKT